MIYESNLVKSGPSFPKAGADTGIPSLARTIDLLLSKTRSVNNFQIKFSTKGLTKSNFPLSEEKREALICILQVQMDNIIQHSQAENVRVCLMANHLGIILYISDDGIGFDLKNIVIGEGLSNVYASTHLFNGMAEIVTAPGEGCSLTVLIPFSDLASAG